AARHRFEQRHTERRSRGGTEIDIGAAIIAGPAAVGVTSEVNARSERTRGALHAPTPWPVTDHGETRLRIALEDPRHRGEDGPQVIARLDPAEPQQPRPALLDSSGESTEAGTEERRVHAVRNDLPRRREVARHRLLSGAADRDRGCMAIEQPLERTAQETQADRSEERRVGKECGGRWWRGDSK